MAAMARKIAPRFVLVRPSNGLNIGAAARALANFGLGDLRVVAPFEQRFREARSAVYGRGLLRKAPLKTVEEAIGDCRLVLGTASAHNRSRRRTELTLPALRDWIAERLPRGGRVAILFGCEKTGLRNSELDRCHALLRIPTASDAPSMNLGQAVAVVAYECQKLGLERAVAEPEEQPADVEQLEGLVDTAIAAMAKAKVNGHLSEEARRDRFRRGLLKWRFSRADASWLRGLLARLARR